MIQKQSNWTIPFLFFRWRHRNYIMFLMTSSIKLWKPQVTDWNLINSEHHFRLEKRIPNRVEPRQPFHGTFSRLWRHMWFYHRFSRPLDMVLIQDMEMKKVVCLFLFWLNLFIFDVTNVPIPVNAVHGG